MQAGGRTDRDMTKLTVTLRNFAKAPTNSASIGHRSVRALLSLYCPKTEDLNEKKKKNENFQVVLCNVECALSLLNGHINQNCMTTHGQHNHKVVSIYRALKGFTQALQYR